jgi:hypothetical protein
MPVKIARSTPRLAFGLPEVLVAVSTSRLSCCKAGKARIFTPVRESSGESRLKTTPRGRRPGGGWRANVLRPQTVTLGSHQTFKDALLRAVDERAAKAGLTRSEWIRRLVEKAEKRRK